MSGGFCHFWQSQAVMSGYIYPQKRGNSSFYFVTNQNEFNLLCVSVINLEMAKFSFSFASSKRHGEAEESKQRG